MNLQKLILALISLTISTPSLLRAEPSNGSIQLANILSSGCVLQRDQPVKIWGTGTPGGEVTVAVKNQSVETKVDPEGDWLVELAAEPAGGPFALTVSGPEGSLIELSDVYFGDVWILTGQSNMFQQIHDQMRVWGEDFYPDLLSDEDDFDAMRFAIVSSIESEDAVDDVKMDVPWNRWEKDSLQRMSTPGYYFARKVKETLTANGMGHIPLGFIKVCKGSTSAEEWVSRDALENMSPPYEGRRSRISGFYNGMIEPIQNYAIKGALWYQGENNSGSYERVAQYTQIMRTLIESWREQWGIDFPFYYVQLAAFRPYVTTPTDDDVRNKALNWAWLREAQSQCLEIPNTAMACIIDTGSQRKIHPPYKDIVGQRLARIALARDYGFDIVHRGPTVSDVAFDGSDVIITFNHVADGLRTQAVDRMPDEIEVEQNTPPVSISADELGGFALSGSDQKFFWAREAEIISPNQIKISNVKDVPNPVAVRYAWMSFPMCNLFNSEGLPAEPFRTDNYEPGSSTGGAL